jgi:hypothetical protein
MTRKVDPNFKAKVAKAKKRIPPMAQKRVRTQTKGTQRKSY